MKIKVLDVEYDVYFKTSDNTVENIDSYSNEILRHELIHAILYECGLSACSWVENEEIVDWLAVPFPKISNIFSIAGVEK